MSTGLSISYNQVPTVGDVPMEQSGLGNTAAAAAADYRMSL